ncbi:MAG: TonB-dependent receptor [Gammaproteobacteria bacterium]|nr:TonB-dependent receptor [Gammaproteobacteria bacterium]
MNKIRSIGLVSGSLPVLMALVLLPQGSWAQRLDEIVVTAQKREQSLLEVPISITVIGGEALDQFGISDFEELQVQIPNFYFKGTPANAAIYIRGIGTTGNVLAFEQSVALFVDGIYGGRNRQFQQPFLDVERIEVLRGPQGALFGRNTSAGAVNITTRRPTEEFEALASAEYELRYDSWNIGGTLSGPVSDDLQLRFTGEYGESGGYVRNIGMNRDEPQRDKLLARLSATWQATDTVEAFGKLEYAKSDVIGAAFEFIPGGGRATFVKNTVEDLAPIVDESTALNAVLQFNMAVGDHELISITGYSSFDYNNAFNIQARQPERLVTLGEEDFRQISQEIRLLSPLDRPIEYVLGLYADRADMEIFRESIVRPAGVGNPMSITRRWFDQDTNTFSGFGQGTWNLSDSWRVTAGLRWTRMSKEADLERTVIGFSPTARTDPLSRKRTESRFDPSFNVQWDATDRMMWYLSYAEGSKSGGFNGASPNDTEATWEFEEESSESFELGTRIALPGGYLNITGYRATYSSLQQAVLDINTASFITGNAGKARSQGVEVDSAWRLTDALQATASGAYLNAKYVSYPNAPCVWPNNQISGCAEDIAGTRLPNAPRFTGTLGLNWDAPVTATGIRLLAGMTAAYQGTTIQQPSLDPLLVQSAYWKLNARLGLAAQNDQWYVTLIVKNLTDEITAGFMAETFPAGINPALDRVHLPDPPRTYTLQAGMRF